MILGLFLAGPLTGVWIVKGTLTSSLTLDVLPLTDPYVLVQALIAGHAIAATGALELAATIGGIRDGFLPPTLNFTEPGDGCDLDFVPNEARDATIGVALSNSFAFGGSNATLVLRQV